jgi:hypothetical protein
VRISFGWPARDILSRVRRVRLVDPKEKDYVVPDNRPAIPAQTEPRLPLRGQASWDVKLVEKEFTPLRAEVDHAQRRFVWLLEARRPYSGYLSDEVKFQARFYDADDARVSYQLVSYEPNYAIQKGERLRLIFYWPADAIVKQTKAIFLINPADKDLPIRAKRPDFRPLIMPLGGRVRWDMQILKDYFDLLKLEVDLGDNRAVGLVEARRRFPSLLANEVQFQARFIGVFGGVLDTQSVTFEQGDSIYKGERVRFTFPWPKEEIVKKTMKIELVKR